MSDDNRSWFSLKDILSIGFSLAALIISCASFYYSNIRSVENTSARIANFTIEPTTKEDPTNGFKNGKTTVNLAFANQGTKQSIILAPDYQFSDRLDLTNRVFGAEVEYDRDAFPFIIKPGELRLIKVRLPIATLLSNLNNGAPATDDPNDHQKDFRKFFAGFQYSAINSAGRVKSASSGMEISVTVSPRGWEEAGPARGAPPGQSNYDLVKLLEDQK